MEKTSEHKGSVEKSPTIYLVSNNDATCPSRPCPCKPPVRREVLMMVQDELYKVIRKAEESKNPDVSLAGIAILSKYEKLVDVIRDIKDWGLEKNG